MKSHVAHRSVSVPVTRLQWPWKASTRFKIFW